LTFTQLRRGGLHTTGINFGAKVLKGDKPRSLKRGIELACDMVVEKASMADSFNDNRKSSKLTI
jgi:hypothetical protein